MKGDKFKEYIIYEDFELVRIEVTFQTLEKLKEFGDILKSIPKEDSYIVDIEGNSKKLKSEEIQTGSIFEDYVEDYNKELYQEGDDIDLEIKIKKSNSNNVINIFSLEKIFDLLDKKTISEQINTFKYLIEKSDRNKQINFKLVNDEGYFSSKRIVFFDNSIDGFKKVETNKFDEIEQFISNVRNIGEKKVYSSPSWFYIQDKNSYENYKIVKIFDVLTIFLSIMYISNSYKLDGNSLEYTISGYKTIEYKLDSEDIKKLGDNIEKITKNLFSLYSWIYNDEVKISDKLGITRNILSLENDNYSLLDLNTNTINSIKSSYNIYLKESVDKYIEVLNETTKFFNDLSIEMAQKATTFSDNFKQNLIGVLTLLFTAAVGEVLGGEEKIIFTKFFQIVIVVFTIVTSTLYFINKKQLKLDIQHYEEIFNKNKDRYSKILNQEDVNTIFDEKDSFAISRKHIENSAKPYELVWKVIIIILIIISSLIIIKFMIDMKINIIKFILNLLEVLKTT